MPRIRVRRTNRGLVPPAIYERAYAAVVEGASIRKVAKEYGVSHGTLARYVKRRGEAEPGRAITPPGYWTPTNRVFTDGQEEKLYACLERADFSLSPREVRKLAFELAVGYNCSFPPSWQEKKMAGKDWFASFMERSGSLSRRNPQATSNSHFTSFHKTKVAAFFTNLKIVLDRHSFQAKDIWNMDETGVTTVQAPVGAVTSAETGTLVTVALAGNALGRVIPPFFIFPRKQFQSHFLKGGPVGCTGSANGSGLMQEDDFLQYLAHFAGNARVSKESKLLLLLDPSHLSLRAIDYCRENGIVLLSFPPYCTHRLKPMDRSVLGPLNTYVNSAADQWMRVHPGTNLTVYDVPSIVSSALPLAVQESNVTSGFSGTGIWPFNPLTFDKDDFAPSYVTDQVQEAENTSDSTVSDEAAQEYSPEFVHPFPKAGPRKNTMRKGIRRTTAILTDSPVRAAWEEARHQRRPKPSSKAKAQTKKLFSPPTTCTAARPSAAAAAATAADTCPSVEVTLTEECLVCCGSFSDSVPGEVWMQCLLCYGWAHGVCTDGMGDYVCHNCDVEQRWRNNNEILNIIVVQ
ncbi:uncharacterized protein LOC134062409 [Sardina pilchardus]|uniref:uncharacterized protein LOC134062409 n=1 Tax=Sardina pilchardus TaxID=27697 RepID=UPI002E160D36